MSAVFRNNSNRVRGHVVDHTRHILHEKSAGKKNNLGWNIKIAEIRFVQRHNNIFLFHYYEMPCLAFPEDDIGFIARDGERTCERQAPDFCARFRRFLYNNTLLCTRISSRPLGSVPEGDTSIPHLQSRMILSPVIRI